MRGKFKQINKKRKGNAVLQRYKVALDEFVKNRSSSENVDHSGDYKYVKKKSRKELRKEKRKLKRAKMKSHYEGKRDFTPMPVVKKDPGKEKNTPIKKKRGNVDKDLPSTSTSKVSVNKQSSKSSCTKKGKTTKLQKTRKQALMQANEQEDKEIKKLERSLGLNKRKNKMSLPQSFVADGLDYILGVLDCGSSGAAMYDSEDDMDIAKNSLSKIEEKESERSEDEEWQADSDDVESLNGGNSSLDGNVDDTDDVDSDDDHKESDGEDYDESMASDAEEEEETTSALMMADHIETSSKSKYTPPHLRNIGDDRHKVELEKLKRKLKGLLNRLSEPNMASISGQLVEMYMSCSRKDMNNTLTDVLLAACVTPSLMPDRLLMEHVLLVSILHHTVGVEVGAHFLETIVRKFHDLYKIPCEGKECDNLIAIIAHLYNFQVVHSLLIFDILKLLMQAFTEKDIKLILVVLRNVGFTLRKDDALALKDLISEAQRKATDVGKNFNDQSRVRFMLETMLALKNNDMRKIPGYDPEPVERYRKLQRSLISQSSSGSDMKLRVSLDCLLRAEQVGRWWIVGSSWSGAPMISNDPTPKITSATGQFSSKVLELARKQRMNTEVRRNIFCVLMTSEDYLDAFEKLLRMGLKDKQEREIVHVLLHCCLQEKTFNAFYAVLGEKFCTHDRRFQMTFQFSLWDKFKEIDNLSSSTFNNLVQLITFFLQRKCLPLSILKVIEFGELDKPKVRFLRQMLTKLLRETEPEDLACIFGKISGIPKLGMLREGLKLFINHFVLKNAQSQGPAEQAALLSDRAQVATRALEAKEAKLKL